MRRRPLKLAPNASSEPALLQLCPLPSAHRAPLAAREPSVVFYVYAARMRGLAACPAEEHMEALTQLSGYLLLVLMAALIVAAIEALNR